MTAPVHEQVAFGEARGRWVLLAAVLGSGVALLDSTVVNIALPTLGRDLGADFAALQWTVNGYTLTPGRADPCWAGRSATATGDGGSSWWAWRGSPWPACSADWRRASPR